MDFLIEQSESQQMENISRKLKWICRVLEVNFPNISPFDDYEHDDVNVSALSNRVDSIVKYLSSALPIEKIPKATGKLREFQNDMSKLLVAFDKACKAFKINYWLDYGTLIGALRHKGFIPWDDDLDVSMMGEDYNRLKEHAEDLKKFNIELIQDCFPLVPYVKWNDGLASKDDGTVPWVDIFVFYNLKPSVTDAYGYDMAKKASKNFNYSRHLDPKVIQRTLDACYSFNRKLEANNANSTKLFRGLESVIIGPWETVDAENVFPLSTGKFEGHNFPIPGKAAARLENYKGYGKGWNSYPARFKLQPKHHSDLRVERQDTKIQSFSEWVKEH